MFKLLSTANPKIQKGSKLGYLSFILHLAPADLSGKEVCPKRTAGCTAACLNTAGRGGMFKKGENTNVIQKARIRKTILFFTDRRQFMIDLFDDIRKAIKQSEKLGLTPVFRLNGTSDIAWEKYTLNDQTVFEAFPDVQFYDYTKIPNRDVSRIPNYYLTFSGSARPEYAKFIERAIAHYGTQTNIAFSFKGKAPATFMGRDVVDGDESDLRFLDRAGVIVALKAKGRARTSNSGFSVAA